MTYLSSIKHPVPPPAYREHVEHVLGQLERNEVRRMRHRAALWVALLLTLGAFLIFTL